MKIKDLILASIFSSLMCIFTLVHLPLPTPVPFTLQFFGVAITGGLLGGTLGAISMIIYIMLGVIGLPVFSGMKGGIQVLVGPTGGYIIGFIMSTFITGYLLHNFVYKISNNKLKFISTFLVITLGLTVSYLIGTIQLKFVMQLTYLQAISAGVLPFIALDLLKVLLATITIHSIYPVLVKSNLITQK
ncbi:MAG: biotin transporter BioY [Epulopiscium sp.]|nr:biotin transporter BioY [Candidatus Epulonipiscium sp.]